MPEQTLGGIPVGLGMVMKINFLNFHVYRIAGKMKIQLRIKFRNFYFRTYGTLSNYAKICTIRKFPAIRYCPDSWVSMGYTHNNYYIAQLVALKYMYVISGLGYKLFIGL